MFADGAVGGVAFHDGLHVEAPGHQGDAWSGEGEAALMKMVLRILGGAVEQGVDQRGLRIDLSVGVGVAKIGREYGFEFLAGRRQHGGHASFIGRGYAGEFGMLGSVADADEE